MGSAGIPVWIYLLAVEAFPTWPIPLYFLGYRDTQLCIFHSYFFVANLAMLYHQNPSSVNNNLIKTNHQEQRNLVNAVYVLVFKIIEFIQYKSEQQYSLSLK